jgi:anti-sigma factor RsiW
MMTCRELAEALGDVVADELHAERRREVGQHLEGCAGCTVLLQNYRLTIQLARRLPPLVPPPALLERLRSGLNA